MGGASNAVGAPAPGSINPAQGGAFRNFLSKVQVNAKQALSQQRPWSELYDQSSFSKPENFNDMTNRVKKNLTYFHVNYALFLMTVVVCSMLMNPTSIFWLFALACLWGYVFFVRSDPVVVYGRILNDRELFIALALITFLVAFGLTSVGSILISGVVIGGAVVVAHAAFKQPDDLFLDENVQGGFMSWLGGGAPPSQQLPQI
eukprot:TRINITY_DN3443_c0_g2_i1.p1 TRINITY_DN3443_c0_g2~~TRINITY_DN3443_c0_g2_i1.p1  ORF type:complete len:203 (+),score=23.32 TRINITY_DN3443_c0_g2_i1:233-841(+)